MIDNYSHTVEWLEAQKKLWPKRDPILIEKVIKALTLLEQLKLVGLDFVFKGGTSQIVLLEECKRFSIDIDLIIPNKPSGLENLFDQVCQMGVFTEWKNDERNQTGHVPKAHYKFYYASNVAANGRGNYVLLDLLYERNVYSRTKNCDVRTQFLKIVQEPTQVVTPTIECLVGDKLTAFAPTTTGVLYGRGKELEIIKQLFDLAYLFEHVNDLSDVLQSYKQIGQQEAAYRGIQQFTYEASLLDTWNTCLAIVTRGKHDTHNGWIELQRGVRNLSHFVVNKAFSIEAAVVCASRVAYLCQLIRKEQKEIQRYEGAPSILGKAITDLQFGYLNKLAKSNPEAFFYLLCAFELL